MRLLVLSASDLREALPMADAVDAVAGALVSLAHRTAVTAPRGVLPVAPPGGTTLVMGAFLPGAGLATKTVSVFPGNAGRGRRVTNGLVVVLDPATGEPAALCDGAGLTALRTGAVAGLATRLLAREDARVGLVVGTGAQARTQVLAIDAVRRLARIWVCGRSRRRAEAFVAELQPAVRAALAVAPSVDDVVAAADVICTATSSTTPVFAGDRLAAGAHVNGIGSFTPTMQEIDERAIGRARVFVESVAAAGEEAGDLLIAEAVGATDRRRWTELGAVAAGGAAGRRGRDEITFFKCVGHAVEDVAAAARAVAVARERGLGRTIEL